MSAAFLPTIGKDVLAPRSSFPHRPPIAASEAPRSLGPLRLRNVPVQVVRLLRLPLRHLLRREGAEARGRAGEAASQERPAGGAGWTQVPGGVAVEVRQLHVAGLRDLQDGGAEEEVHRGEQRDGGRQVLQVRG